MPAYRWALGEIYERNDPKAPKDLRLPPPSAFVLLMIADAYNEDWSRAWPSQPTLAQRTGLGLSTVGRAVADLRGRGLVAVEHWMKNDGAEHMPNRYLLPRYRPKVQPARQQPVLAFGHSDSLGASWDSMRQLPGSNLYIEEADLAA